MSVYSSIENINVNNESLQLTQPLYLGKLYKHFKHGDLYYTLGITRNCELEEGDLEFLEVEYVQLKSGKVYHRPIVEFTSYVDRIKYPKINETSGCTDKISHWNQDYRFELILPDNSQPIYQCYNQFMNVDNIPVQYRSEYEKQYLCNMIRRWSVPKQKDMSYTDAIEFAMSHKATEFITRPEWLGAHFISKQGYHCIMLNNGNVIIEPDHTLDTDSNDWMVVKMHRFALDKLKTMNLI